MKLVILMSNGQTVEYKNCTEREREKIMATVEKKEAIRLMQEGHWTVLNPAHVVSITSLASTEAREEPAKPAPAHPHPREGEGRCKACRGRGTIVRVEGRIKKEVACGRCGGSGKEPETGGVGFPE